MRLHPDLCLIMKNEAAALCDAAEAFQEACNAFHEAKEAVDAGDGGTPVLDDVQDTYSNRFRTLSREIYYLRKAITSAVNQEADAARYRKLRAGNYSHAIAQRILNDTPESIDAAVDALP